MKRKLRKHGRDKVVISEEGERRGKAPSLLSGCLRGDWAVSSSLSSSVCVVRRDSFPFLSPLSAFGGTVIEPDLMFVVCVERASVRERQGKDKTALFLFIV